MNHNGFRLSKWLGNETVFCLFDLFVKKVSVFGGTLKLKDEEKKSSNV